MKGIKHIGLKIICIILLFYTVVMSYNVPLEPGIAHVKVVSNDSVFSLKVTGYNVQSFNDNFTAYLYTPDSSCLIQSFYFQKSKSNEFMFQFNLPDTLSSDLLHLVIPLKPGGKLFYPSVFVGENVVVEATFKYGEWPRGALQEDKAFNFPFQNILYETIRNLNFHVTMWFVTMFLFLLSFIYSIKSLGKQDFEVYDLKASIAVKTGLFFTALGIVTGSLWAKNTWGAWWVNDPKLNGAAISALIYIAYIILRNAIDDQSKRMKISAVYNIFAFTMFIVFIQVLPRFTRSLHPGNGGNPAFSAYDLDNNLRLVFYPAVLGFILLGWWIWQLAARWNKLKLNNDEILED